MLKRPSIMTIHPSLNISTLDEFQIETNKRSKLPRFQIGNGEIQNHIDISKFIKNGESCGQKLRTYKRTRNAKCQTIVDYLYSDLKVNELMKTKLSIDKVKFSELNVL